MSSSLAGRQKAAVLLVSLGAEASAAVFKHLRQEEIDELTLEIAGIGHVSPERKHEVVQEFYEVALAQEYIAEGGSTTPARSWRRRSAPTTPRRSWRACPAPSR